MTDKNKAYKILLFDVDDTLLDFGANEKAALPKVFAFFGYPLTDELLHTYHRINKQLWDDYEHGKVTMNDMLNSRFAKTMAEFGIAVDGMAWETHYQALLGGGYHIIEDAPAVCQRLAQTHRLFVVTNGVKETQHKRLKLAGLHGWFEDIFNSQSIGYQKPAKAFFDHVKSHIDGFDTRDALIIGDSLNTDIKGGIASGIDTCWFNKRKQECVSDIRSTYTITKLTELYDILALGEKDA